MNLQPLSATLSAVAPALGNHLWQSTLFAVAAGMLTLALRKNHARVRYWLWLAASVKFLVPFSVLVALGSRLSWWHAPAATNAGLFFALDGLSEPFARSTISPPSASTLVSSLANVLPGLLTAVWLSGFAIVPVVWLLRYRRISVALQQAAPLREGREVEALRRLASAGGVQKKIEIFLSPAALEPGILGVARPVLLWPEGISDRLEDSHLEAILAHEVWHVRRHDNLAAMVHMLVEALFWFHPLVWWLGGRLVEERERACDEAVLQSGSDMQIYAESILEICKFCVGSPLVCVSGVTGADLKKRIVNIMNKNVVRKLNFGKKLLLSTLGVAAIALPVVFGLARPARSSAQNAAPRVFTFITGYQNVSITPGETGDGIIQSRIIFAPDSLMAKNQTLHELIKLAYGVQANQVSGGPDWMTSARFNVEAKLGSSTVAELKKLDPEQQKMEREQMFQTLLADQFKVALHRESKLLPAYVLVIATNGPKIQPAKPGDTYPNGIKGLDGLPAGAHKFAVAPDEMTVQALPMSIVVERLAMHLNQPVQDRTGLVGDYDFTFKWAPEPGETTGTEIHGGKETAVNTKPVGGMNASLLAAMEEQLGLKLDPQTIPLPVLVIDRAAKPSAN